LTTRKVEVEPAETVLQVSLRSGIPHPHACGGNARCSTCRVLVLEGIDHCIPRNDKEQNLADRLHFTPEIRLACQTMISNDVKLRRLVLDDEDLQLTDPSSTIGEERKLAVLFADIRGFTPFAEALPAYDVIHVLNRYFHEMGQVINRNGGQIDNYMGDGLMALFGMEDTAGAAFQAVRAGLEMHAAMERLKPYLRTIYAKSFHIGVGVHYGDVVVGAIGAQSLKRVTAVGDAVNLASRIEAANNQAGTGLLISEETYHEVKGRVRLGNNICLTLPGKTGEYALYEVVGLSDSESELNARS